MAKIRFIGAGFYFAPCIENYLREIGGCCGYCDVKNKHEREREREREKEKERERERKRGGEKE